MTGAPVPQPEHAQPDDWLGKVISGKYRVVRVIGRGGMGCVYEVENIRIGRMMALKRILPVHSTDAEIMKRFELEARAAGGLLHENILAVTDFEQAEDGTPYLVMELLIGESLSKLLKRVPFLDSRRATDLVVQACRGLAVAHNAGIVHRDLKPANLFLCQRGDGGELVKILDFGIAKLKGGKLTGDSETRPGSVIGTPKYMSPEQARGDAAVDTRTDLYALGVILYEALSNKLPHPGANDAQILFHIQTAEPIPLSEHRPDLPRELCAVVEKALARDPAGRLLSALAFEQALLSAVHLSSGTSAPDGATRASLEAEGREARKRSLTPGPMGLETHAPVQVSKFVRSKLIDFAVILGVAGVLASLASSRFLSKPNPAKMVSAPGSGKSGTAEGSHVLGSESPTSVPSMGTYDAMSAGGRPATATATSTMDAGGAPKASIPLDAQGGKGSNLSARTPAGQAAAKTATDRIQVEKRTKKGTQDSTSKTVDDKGWARPSF